MIKIQVISFECATPAEAAELASRFGLMQPQQNPLGAPVQQLDLTQEAETVPFDKAVSKVADKVKKEKKAKVKANLGNKMAEAAMLQSGIEPHRAARGTYKPIYELEVNASTTLANAQKKGLASAIWRAKKLNPGREFSFKETTAGKFRITRTA